MASGTARDFPQLRPSLKLPKTFSCLFASPAATFCRALGSWALLFRTGNRPSASPRTFPCMEVYLLYLIRVLRHQSPKCGPWLCVCIGMQGSKQTFILAWVCKSSGSHTQRITPIDAWVEYEIHGVPGSVSSVDNPCCSAVA